MPESKKTAQFEKTDKMSDEEIRYQKKKFVFKISFLSFLLFIILVFMYLYPTLGFDPVDKVENFGIVKSPYFCKLKKGELCANEYTQVVGRIEDKKMYPGLGHKFELEDSKGLTNEVYIKDLVFTTKTNGRSNLVYHKIPFGSKMVIRGKVVNMDKYRCNNRAYAKENSEYCSEDSFRILISPDAIEAVPSNDNVREPFSYFITSKNSTFIKEGCKDVVELCEGSGDLVCHDFYLPQLQCNKLETAPHMYLFSGYKDKSGVIEPTEVYTVWGVDYSSSETVDDLKNDQDFISGDTSAIGLYDYLGNELLSKDIGDDIYFDYNDAIPVTDGVYYFDDQDLTIKFADFNGNLKTIQKLVEGAIPNEPARPNYHNFVISPDENELLFVSNSQLSQNVREDRTVERTVRYDLYSLNLVQAQENTGNAQTLIYTSIIKGYLHLEKANFEERLFLISESEDYWSGNGCTDKQYFLYDQNTDSRLEIANVVENNNIYCNETVSRKLYVSDDAKILIFGDNFNNNYKSEVSYKLNIFSVNQSREVLQSTYLTTAEMLNKQFIDIDDLYLTVYDLRDNSVLSDFNLFENTYVSEKLVPQDLPAGLQLSNEAESEVGEMPPYPGTDYPPEFYEQVDTGIKNVNLLLGATLIHQDDNRFYFWKRVGFSTNLYVLDVGTKNVLLASSFSVLAVPHVVDGVVVVVDIVKDTGCSGCAGQ